MSIDPIDITREENRRTDNKKTADHKDTQKNKNAQDFAARYQQAKIKAKESKLDNQVHDRSSKAKEESEKALFNRVLEVFSGKDETKKDDRNNFGKKEDVRKEEKLKDQISLDRPKSVSEEGHSRVAEKSSSHQDGEGKKGGRDGEGHSGGGQQEKGSSGGQSGNQSSSGWGGQSRNSFASFSKGNEKTVASPFSLNQIKESKSGGGSSSSQKGFSQKALDEIVESVRVGLNVEGDYEMEVSLSEETFSGLKIRVSHTPDGVVVVFACPNREVRDLFLLHRPQVYSKLKEKQVVVSRVEVTTL